jgi:hypothetical protein
LYLLVVFNREALKEKWRVRPRPVEAGHIDAQPELLHWELDDFLRHVVSLAGAVRI